MFVFVLGCRCGCVMLYVLGVLFLFGGIGVVGVLCLSGVVLF